MIFELGLGGVVIAVAVMVQVGFIAGLDYAFTRYHALLLRPPRQAHLPIRLAVAALWLLAAHGAAIWLWASAFMLAGAFEELDLAVYYASVCFTTLGFGDIAPQKGWRVLSGLSAAHGLLTFGVSIAYMVELMRQLWEEKAQERARRFED